MRLLRERLRAARPMLAGRPHEAAGNGSPRWMAAGPRSRGCTEPGLQANSPAAWPSDLRCCQPQGIMDGKERCPDCGGGGAV